MYLFFIRICFRRKIAVWKKGVTWPLLTPFLPLFDPFLTPFWPLFDPFLTPFLTPFFWSTFFFQKKSFSQMKIIFEKKIVKIVRRLVVVPELIRRSVWSHFNINTPDSFDAENFRLAMRWERSAHSFVGFGTDLWKCRFLCTLFRCL